MSTIIESIEQRQKRRVPRFGAGDRVRVHFQVIEGTRKRTQVFEGVVLKRQGNGLRETFTVRKQSFGVGVERTFPLHSPKVEKLEVAARGDVRRAKLYYLRDRVGKAARVAERRWGIEEDFFGAEEVEAVDAEGVSQQDLAEEAGDAIAGEAGDEAGEPGDEAGEPVGEQAQAPSDEQSAAEEPAAEEPAAEEPAAAEGEPAAEEESEEAGGPEDQAENGEEPAEAKEEASG